MKGLYINMAVINLSHKSESLEKQTDAVIVLPEKLDKNFKILYLLHGLSDNQTDWLFKTSLARYALKNQNLCVVCPDGGKSFYTNMKSGLNYYDYVARELPEYVEKLIPFSGKREDRYIAGLSMGGYGALKIAFKNPERYYACASFSGVCDIRYRFDQHTFDTSAIFDGDLPQSEDLFYLSSQVDKKKIKPIVYQWCGTEDFMYEDNLRFRDHMKKLSFDYTYNEYSGDHCWERWDEQIEYIIKLFNL